MTGMETGRLPGAKAPKRPSDSETQVAGRWKRGSDDQDSVFKFIQLEDPCGFELADHPSNLGVPSAVIRSQEIEHGDAIPGEAGSNPMGKHVPADRTHCGWGPRRFAAR